jgi:cytosine deaminase
MAVSGRFDIIVRGARLRHRPDTRVDIGIASGRIAALDGRLDGQAGIELEARGGLVTEAFVNPHLHLCKVYTLQRLGDDALRAYQGAGMGKAMTAVELAARVKDSYDEAWIIGNVRRAVALAALHGTTHLRAFADVDHRARLEGVRALLRARDEFRGIVNLQVVAFAQDGIVREPGAADLLREAVALGADVVGGIPWIEYTEADAARHVGEIFDIAQAHDRDVSMLVDDAGDPGLRTLEGVAVETIRRGWQGRVLAHHARAMALYPLPYFQKLAGLLRQARMAVVADPHTGPLHARVRELLTEDVVVCLGQDDISDAYYPYGRNSMLEVAFLSSHLLWMMAADEMETLYDMITRHAARAIGLRGDGVVVGAPAHLVVLDAPNVREALREHAAPAHVISFGRLVDQAAMRALATNHGMEEDI